MFSEILEKISWEETTARIASKTDADVRRALSKERCDVEDFMALISPAASPYLETMARLSKKYTEERFGKTVSMFVPLYLTNSCTNSCVYCGFHASNPMKRVILTETEIVNEYKAIKKLAPFENLLLVTGENPAKAGVPYIARALDLARPYFSNLKIEVMPLKAEEYAELKGHGLNGVICFQETYHKAHYNIYHPKGMKSKFEWRVNGFDRMGQAGVHSIGMGVLIGLEKEWRTDIAMMAYHLRYLQKHYWKTKYSINFPRMRPSENGDFQPNATMSDRELAQATFAMRIFDHDVDISYSTREPARIRDHMGRLGVTTMSAESKTEPGGYCSYPQTLEQFRVSDGRKAAEVDAALKHMGREPVWKDWDASLADSEPPAHAPGKHAGGNARYQRQTSLPEIGEAGQKRLRDAKVLIVGLGGLGSPISLYLAGAGAGKLGLVDSDVVSLHNLHRQVLYSEAEVNRPKAECAARRIKALNSETSIEAYPLRLDASNALRIISGYDVVVDGCDNYATRYVISDACQALGVPYVYGAICGFQGQVSVFCRGRHAKTYRDLYPDELQNQTVPPPVIGVTPGIIGCVETNEVLKLIIGHGELLAGKLWTIDLRTMETCIINL